MYAIITGATSGIGKEFAIYYAERGYKLILTGRREKELTSLKDRLETVYKVEVILILGDFSEKKVLDELFLKSEGKEIRVLINNVGYGNENSFFNGSVEESIKMIEVQINSTIKICHNLIPKMSKGSLIINVSSLAALFPTAYNHTYAASKSFLISFSKSLQFSLKDKSVKVLLPGFTYTDFHRYTEVKTNKNSFWMTAEKVVKLTVKDLDKNRVIIVPGFYNKVFYLIGNYIPKTILDYFLKKQLEL